MFLPQNIIYHIYFFKQIKKMKNFFELCHYIPLNSSFFIANNYIEISSS